MRALLRLVLAVLVWCSYGGNAVAAPGDLQAEVLQHGTPQRLCPAEATRVAITVLNTGKQTWTPQSRDRLSYHWRDSSGRAVVYDGQRTELPGPIAPGRSAQLQARLVAPPDAGALTLQWKLVREGVRWVPTDGGEVTVQIRDSDRPALALSVTAGGPSQPVAAGAEFSVAVTVDNLGCSPWSAAIGDNLAYHWYDEVGQVVEFEGQRTPLPAVASGERATVDAVVRAPEQAGSYRLQWAMVREGLAWVEVDPDASSWPRAVTIGEPPLRWSWTPIDPLPELAVGEVATVALSLTNTGTEAWRDEAGDRLGYRWHDAQGNPVADEGLRTPLPVGVVEPGQRVQIEARVQAPSQTGAMSLAWSPVREHVRWYGPPTAGPRLVPTTITPQRLSWALVHVDDPGAVLVGREGTLAVTVRNTGADAWSETTADHLSYRWRASSGEVVDEGMRTVLPKDVAPGATAELAMRIRGPDAPGRYTLEIEMVREHVAWFGAPVQGQANLVVVASRAAVGVSIAFVFATVALVALRRKHWPSTTAAGSTTTIWIADRVGLPLWTALSVGLIGEVFIELGGVPHWEGSAAIAWSCAAGPALLVAVLPVRAQAWGAALVATGATALALADLAYLEFFGSIVPLTAVAAVHHLGDAHGTVSSLLSLQHLWLLTIPGAGVLLACTLGPRAQPPGTRARWRTRLVVILLGVLAAMPAIRQLGHSLQGRLGARVFSQYNNVGRFGVFGAHWFELARQIRDAIDAPEPPSGEARQRLDAFFASRAQARKAATPVTGKAAGYNVVILQVEALSSWARGLVVDGQPVTPFLDAADDAWLSMSVYDQTAQGRTSDAEFLVMSSGHPLAEGALSFRHDGNDFETLVHALSERGYASLSAHPYARGFWNRAVLHPRYGFSDSMFRRELGPGPVVGWGLADGPFLERMLESIVALPQPWVTFMITLSLHHPYDDFPDALEELSLGTLAETPVGNYLQAVRHFDSSLAAFMAGLSEHGLAKHTIVVIYGDHITGMESKRAVWSLAGWESWSPDLPTRIRQVPLMVWAPGLPKVAVDPVAPHGQIEIGPTVLDLLGVTAPAGFVGRSVVAPGRSSPVVLPDGSAVSDDRLLVATGRDIGREGVCFDLPSGTTRPRADCDALAAHARDELSWSRAVLEHDLHRDLP